MNPIGVVICNYNKKDFVLECVQSVQESTIQNFDIYVVDNASTDGSVEALQEVYGDEITILANTENLGGSGGFNTGLRVVRDKGYDYFMCLDDDALVDENAINVLYEYMEKNPDVGMAGCRVYHRQMPEYIQQSGLMIDFDRCTAQTIGADQWEDGTLPDVIECDTVATCAVMVRGSMIRDTDVGIMPEDNFIYWDDMEWGYRIRLAGYRVVTLAASKALHQMGAKQKRPNTFTDYYMWRNRTNFFMRYMPEERLEEMSARILGDFFDAMYERMYRENHNVMQTLSYAYQDAINGVRGKAKDYEILPNDDDEAKLIAYIKERSTYAICATNEMKEDVTYLKNFLREHNETIQEVDEKEAEMLFSLCPYVFQVDDFALERIYIDSERNAILDADDIIAVKNYQYSKLLYIYMNQGVFLAATQKLRGEER